MNARGYEHLTQNRLSPEERQKRISEGQKQAWKRGKTMGKKVRVSKQELLNALEDVVCDAVYYVGSANYREREAHAIKVVSKAFRDYQEGIVPKWFEDLDEDSDEN